MGKWLMLSAFCFCLGDAGAFYERQELFYAGVAGVGIWGVTCILALYLRRNYGDSGKICFCADVKRDICILISLLMIVFGFLAGKSSETGKAQWKKFIGKPIVLQGFVQPNSLQKREQGIRAVFTAEFPLRGNVRIFIRTDKNDTDRVARDLLLKKVQVSGILQENVYLWNPGAYDGYKADRIHGIYGKITASPGDLWVLDDPIPIYLRFSVFSHRIREAALSRMKTREAAILPGMILGGYQGVDPEDADVFRDNGTAHLLAVSGTHVAVLTAFLNVLLQPVGIYRTYIIQVLLFLYALVCGLQPSVIRAVFMACVLLWGERTKRRADRFRLLLLTAMALLLIHPFWLLDIGWQLSFATTAGLLLSCSRVTGYIPENLPDWIRSLAGVSLTAQIFSLPFVIFYFHRVSLIGIISNLILLPGLETAAFLFLIAVCLLPLVPFISGNLMQVAEFLARGAVGLGTVLAKIPFSAVDVADWGRSGMACYCAFLFVFLDIGAFKYISSRKRRYLLLIIGMSALFLMGIRYLKPQPLTVHFMDVGQGDAALIRTPAGKNILVDTGGFMGEGDVSRMVLLPYLRYLGVKKIDLLCLSHGDHDHAGGAAGLAGKLPVRTVFLGISSEESPDVKNLLEKVGKETSVQRLYDGEQWQIGDCRIVVASASSGQGNTVGITDSNSASLVLQFFCQGHSLIFTGDADGDTEERAVKYLQRTDVLKVSHHGSDSSSSSHFLHHICPRYGVISVGANNRYGHPAPGALERLQAAGILPLRTDRLGAIKIEFTKDGPRWYSYRYQGNQF